MDKTLKLLLGCLGLAAVVTFIIPSGDPLTTNAPVAAPMPASALPAPMAPSTPTAPTAPTDAAKRKNPDELPPEYANGSDKLPANAVVDSSVLQQQTFGQPMLDPRPASERMNTSAPAQGGDAQSSAFAPESNGTPQYAPAAGNNAAGNSQYSAAN